MHKYYIYKEQYEKIKLHFEKKSKKKQLFIYGLKDCMHVFPGLFYQGS